MAGKADAWMPFYVADYLRKTMHLTREQHGGYFLLLLACWDRGGRLPNDPAQLAAIAKATPAEWRKLAPVLLPYFEVEGDSLIHRRVLEEREKAARISEARRKAGLQGGRPPKQSGSTSKANAFANAKQTETHARVALHSHKPPPSEESPPFPPQEGEGKASRRKPRTPIPDGFPTPELIAEQQAKAREAGADLGAEFQAERFRQWCLSKDQRYADWAAAWRNWMAKAIAEAPKAVTRRDIDMDRVWRLRLSTFKRTGGWDGDWEAKPGKPGCIVPAHILREFGFEPTPSPATDPDKEAA